MYKITIGVIVTLALFISSCKKVTTYEQDVAKLEAMKSEIKAIASSKVCDNPEDWNFTHYGYKSCGGNFQYIAYSKKVDTKKFLKKVDEYTSYEKKLYDKWGWFSTCEVINPPKTIVCKDEKAVLVF